MLSGHTKSRNSEFNGIIEKSGLFFLLVMLAVLAYLASIRVDFTTQAYISVYVLLALIILRTLKHRGFLHVLFVIFSSYIVLRYFSWRITYTLVSEDLLSYVGTIALFMAELYGGLMFFFSIFVNISPVKRKPIPLPTDTATWPTVDIIIPTFDEPFDLVKITLASARNIDYPPEKLNIYLLDDGGTTDKLSSSDTDIRENALTRSTLLKQYCADLNINYLTREKNLRAKAGNMNNALKFIKGELILVLDADHMPSLDILQKTVGAFLKDEKLFLVQTPHFFINPDPFEKNLSLFYRMPAESDMFYKGIQTGLDSWHSTFFCGSAAVLRRSAIDEIGGFSGKTITEDSETTIKLHSRGWRSIYIMHPLIAGLQPETFDSFMIQRMRWAQGMVQNFIFNNPLLVPNLSISQRICYLSSMLFWFFPLARVIFLIAPGLYLFFGLKIYHANIAEFLSYTIPFMLALLLTNHYIFSEVRWVFISEIYETMQSMFSFRAVLSAIKNPNKPQFSVTPKMEMLHQDLISPLSHPFYWALGYTLFSIAAGVWRFNMHPDENFIVIFTSFWAFYNMLLLMATLGALYEHRQRRANPRVPVHIKVNWLTTSNGDVSRRIPLVLRDVSMGGGNLVSRTELPLSQPNELNFLEFQQGLDQPPERFQVSVTTEVHKKDDFFYGVKFVYNTLPEYLNLVKFIHGDSSRWVKIYHDTGNNPGLIKSIFFMIKTGMYHGVSHLNVVLTSFLNKLTRAYV